MGNSSYIWINGKTTYYDDASTHLLTHGLHYGSGVFEGIRFYNTKYGPAIFRLEEHIKRLFNSAKTFDMQIEYKEEDINRAITDTIKTNKLSEGYIRPIIFVGHGLLKVNPKNIPITTAIAVWPWGKYLGEKPVRVKLSKIMKTHPQTTNPEAKITGNYQNSVLASIDIRRQGYDEALLLDYRGYVAEGPGENIFMIKDDKIYTPKLGSILPGITRDTVINILKDDNRFIAEKDITLEELLNADETFFTGTAAEVTPIHSINEKTYKNNIGTRLNQKYANIVRGKNDKYIDWLTFVD